MTEAEPAATYPGPEVYREVIATLEGTAHTVGTIPGGDPAVWTIGTAVRQVERCARANLAAGDLEWLEPYP
jgi:hypothetical protein